MGGAVETGGSHRAVSRRGNSENTQMERRQLQVMQWHAYWMRPAKAEALLRGGGWLAKQCDARLAIIHVVALPPASAKLDYVVYERDVVTSA